MKSILILGIGNQIRADDAIGIFVAKRLGELISDRVDVKYTSLAGLSLLQLMEGYNRVVLIDSISTKDGRPGTVYRLGKDDFKACFDPYSSHQLGLGMAVELAQKLGIMFPQELIIYAVEVKPDDRFCDRMSSGMDKVGVKLSQRIKEEVSRWQ